MADIKENKVSKNLITYISPTSVVSEAYRRLRTNLMYSSVDKKLKSVIITSPDMQDGKTVTACNLAISMATTENKVLLIDADLRKPNIHNQFNMENRIGLTNIIMEESDLDEALHEFDDIQNLEILTAGTLPPNPSEILASNKLKEFIRYISNIYDIVIIDTPPLCYVSDGIILAGMVDGVILTVSAQVTKINHAQTAVKALRNVDASILGVVMTKIKRKKTEEYRYYE